MYTSEFDYRRANTLAEAFELLAQDPEAKLLAGGHSLIPAMKLRLANPSMLVDISQLSELKGIGLEGEVITIGAMVTHRNIEFSSLLKSHLPILPEAASLIGDPAVRNKGTIGGALAHADPAADYPAVMIALDASFKLASPNGSRVLRAEDFFQGLFETALAEGEILSEIHIPLRAGYQMAYEKFAHPASRYAVVGVGVLMKTANGICQDIRVGLTGAADYARRLNKVEDALNGQSLSKTVTQTASQDAVDVDSLLSDNFAPSDYRQHLLTVICSRALNRAAQLS
ncbi:MAG: xanthine dehydrogenase family protein subunit M [Deinococcales bacterium]